MRIYCTEKYFFNKDIGTKLDHCDKNVAQMS